MVAVKEFSWEDVSSPDFGNPARVAWREAVAEIADKARANASLQLLPKAGATQERRL